jgi:AcrR family transcriptional regulator
VTNKLSQRGRRTQAESARTRSRILDRSERLFARKGYQAVSIRELARACGVRPFTIQHHFGSKLALYQAVLCRWDGEVLRLLSDALAEEREFPSAVGHVVDVLFEFVLTRRDWVAITARAALGEGLPRGTALEDRGWVRFMETTMSERSVGGRKLDAKMLLVSVEGMLNNHVLSAARYRLLFGRDVTDPGLKARTKRHLKSVILALVESEASAADVRAPALPPRSADAQARRAGA